MLVEPETSSPLLRLRRTLELKEGFSGWELGVIFVLTCAVFVARKPDAILQAQFWAEDGHVWFADAYNIGWSALLRAQDAYLQTLPRLAAGFAVHLPITIAPLALNCLSICLQAIPAIILLSCRSSGWGNLRFRVLLAGMYVVMPNSREMIANITSSQWILAFCCFLLLVGAPPKGTAARALDAIAFLLCGVSGPFCFFLLPVAIILAYGRRHTSRVAWIPAVLFASTCLIQSCFLLAIDSTGRAHATLGASPDLLMRILSADVVLGTLLGANGLGGCSSFLGISFLLSSVVAAAGLLVFELRRLPREMKLLCLFSFAVLAASLASPVVYPPPGETRWAILAQVGGIRYWFFPSLVFAWLLLYCSQSKCIPFKRVSILLLAVMCFGIARDFRQAKLEDLRFPEYAKQLESAPSGAILTIPENPPGWNMQLRKR